MENGVKYVDKISPEIVGWMKEITDKPRMFSLGCFYRKDKWMSMFGQVTDAQVFGRELTDREMIDITGCRSALTGDIISWETEPWTLTSPGRSSRLELLDYERDVCARQDVSQGVSVSGLYQHGDVSVWNGDGASQAQLQGVPAHVQQDVRRDDELHQPDRVLSHLAPPRLPRQCECRGVFHCPGQRHQ